MENHVCIAAAKTIFLLFAVFRRPLCLQSNHRPEMADFQLFPFDVFCPPPPFDLTDTERAN